MWSPGVANFLEAARRYGEKDEAAEFLRFTFDRDMSRTVGILASVVPTNGFSNKEAYRSWISEQAWFIDQALEIANQSP